MANTSIGVTSTTMGGGISAKDVKTINGESILGSGNIEVVASGGGAEDVTAFRVTSTHDINYNHNDVIKFDNVFLDTDNIIDTNTFRLVPKTSGYYHLNAIFTAAATSQITLRKNGDRIELKTMSKKFTRKLLRKFS